MGFKTLYYCFYKNTNESPVVSASVYTRVYLFEKVLFSAGRLVRLQPARLVRLQD